MSRLFRDHRQPLLAARESSLNIIESEKQIKTKLPWFKNRSVSLPSLKEPESEKAEEKAFATELKSLSLRSFHGTSIIHKLVYLHPQRLISFHHVPRSVGLNSFLSQCSGGPVEKVSVSASFSMKKHQRYRIDLVFWKDENASKFFQYAASGRLIVNGLIIRPVIQDKSSHHFSHRSPTRSETVDSEMSKNLARRCITLSKKSAITSRTDARLASLEHVKMCFSAFGQVIDIMHMIKPGIQISIHYLDVRCAITAKKVFDKNGDDLCREYFRRGWRIAYGDDPIDRNVPAMLTK